MAKVREVGRRLIGKTPTWPPGPPPWHGGGGTPDPYVLPGVDWALIKGTASDAIQSYGTEIVYNDGSGGRTIRAVIYKDTSPESLAGDLDLGDAWAIVDPLDFENSEPPKKFDLITVRGLAAVSFERHYSVDYVELIKAENQDALYRLRITGG